MLESSCFRADDVPRTFEQGLTSVQHTQVGLESRAWYEVLRIHTRHKLAVPGRFETCQATGKPLLVQVEILWLHICQQSWR